MIIIIAALLFAGLVGVILLGARLRQIVPAEHLSTDSKDAVKLALGLVATMTALLLGLLVSSAKNSFDTARSEVIQMSAKIALLDRILVLYGPQTADGRRALRESVAEGIRRTWPPDGREPARLEPNEQMGDAVYSAITRLGPQDELQRALKA